jgi:hypothetical protein
MTETLTIRLPKSLARDFRAKTRAAKTNPTEVLRRAMPPWSISAVLPAPGMVTVPVKNYCGGRGRDSGGHVGYRRVAG